MLDYSILKGKSTIELPYDYLTGTTTKCKDLLSKVIDTENVVINDCNVVTVTKEYVARPDLVSLAVYGNDMYADIICKINGISNPFELNTGMILVIPDFASIIQICKLAKASETLANSSEYISKSVKTNQKTKQDKRSPGEQIIGENTFVIDRTNKLVYY
jgi:hypothetical protein